jgi:hypothetical protein
MYGPGRPGLAASPGHTLPRPRTCHRGRLLAGGISAVHAGVPDVKLATRVPVRRRFAHRRACEITCAIVSRSVTLSVATTTPGRLTTTAGSKDTRLCDEHARRLFTEADRHELAWVWMAAARASLRTGIHGRTWAVHRDDDEAAIARVVDQIGIRLRDSGSMRNCRGLRLHACRCRRLWRRVRR